MVDYALFEPRIWCHVDIHHTLQEFLSTAMFQVVRRVPSKDPTVENNTYPTFERDWRREIAPSLRRTLSSPPDALCPGIHRVIPIGVSSADALQAMEVAIPKDIQDPYTITVESLAVDDQCGSIAITQPMRYTVVNVNCMINPGILVDVCRELRTGHRAVVQEVHLLKDEIRETKAETNRQLVNLTSLVTKLMEKRYGGESVDALQDDEPIICTKNRCSNEVTKRFRSGKRQRQCTDCAALVARSKQKVSVGKHE
jgi:hypothetical protein